MTMEGRRLISSATVTTPWKLTLLGNCQREGDASLCQMAGNAAAEGGANDGIPASELITRRSVLGEYQRDIGRGQVLCDLFPVIRLRFP